MIVRKAIPEDSEAINPLFLLVMRFMVNRFIGEENDELSMNFFTPFIRQQGNQYSYDNCFVAEIDKEIVGVINVYDGALLKEMQRPVLDYIHKNLNPNLTIEDETQPGEFYIDVLSVSPKHQGKGIGSILLKHAIKEICQNNKKTLGLLVDHENPNAKRLYLTLGFEKVGEKILSGHQMDHLQFKI